MYNSILPLVNTIYNNQSFPSFKECLEPNAKERELWLLLAYMFRACSVPNEEYDYIQEKDVKNCMKKFYNLFEKLFGKINCSYSVHVVCSHLPTIRGNNPLTESSAFCFENFYGEMRKCFVPGTKSTSQQIIKKVLMKSILRKHQCESDIYISPHDSALECNSLIYTFKDGKHSMYKVVGVKDNEKTLICKVQGKYPCVMKETPTLNWSKVGFFAKGGILDKEVLIDVSNVAGKVVSVQNYLITCPNNVLREK